ncbi:toll/interleukin-1 receptor domain-containing protein [Rhizobium leguminosarum]|uniref:toll/interleukin-1 receptor domain-containing protein n=1 Tax=Rhizobium leguminosarum TaxID=384 RepID=UPI00103BAE16|nr:toll/interleukin-1 receptor domain-containing protein [Rhizobium leguminosarum]TBZ14786.1 tetratricopeptide repeat protein [Rhizobium leguminosarum bv. viciae]
MRVLLSHASIDKGFVEAVSDNLRPGTFELDSETFDAGLVNSQAIVAALSRCDVFCLFLSRKSVNSAYVNFETLLGIEFFAKAKISQFLVFCLDDEVFSQANANIKFFNIIRKTMDPESVARAIQGHAISVQDISSGSNHPFVGREVQISELEEQIADYSRPLIKALYISGNAGSGRKTLARKFYDSQFPHVGKLFARIEIWPFDGQEELFRTVLMSLRPSITSSDLRSRVSAFSISNQAQRGRQISDLINSLLPAREAALLFDYGGVLTDSGGFSAEISEVISYLDARPHPPAIFISPRMIPKRNRRKEKDIAYSSVSALSWDSASRLLSRLLKEKIISFTADQLTQLTALSECHPYNIYRLIELVEGIGVSAFLANPKYFNDWKHRQSSEYLDNIEFGDVEKSIVGVLKIIPQLDFESIVKSTTHDASFVEEALQRLIELHIVDAYDNRFLIAPAVRMAAERDARTQLSKEQTKTAMEAISRSLNIRIEEGSASFNLINSAVLSSIESGTANSEFIAAFILPSHHVWLSKHHYDQRNWADSIRYGQEAIKGRQRLSSNGFVAACRYVCLSSARLNREDTFAEAIQKLEQFASDDWSKSNVAYLKGFNLRNKGNLPAAETFFQQSIDLSPGNHSALRELAAIALARGNVDKAETFARGALEHSPRNAYLIDILITILIRKHGRQASRNSEIDSLFDVLRRVGEENGRSFFTTRKAEFEHAAGDNKVALDLIQKAIAKTPSLFEPHRLHAEILLKDGNKVKAAEVLEKMRAIVENRDRFDRRFNYRSYLVTLSRYYAEVGRFPEAKQLFDDEDIFTNVERENFLKEIEISESYRRARR